MFRFLKVFLLSVMMVGISSMALPVSSADAAIYLGDSMYLDETSAVKILDDSDLNRAFAVNVYTVDANNNVTQVSTVWFYFSLDDGDNRNTDNINENVARCSWDGFDTWHFIKTNHWTTMGNCFRYAWHML